MTDPRIYAMRDLWAAVLDAAWQDALGPLRYIASNVNGRQLRAEARQWFRQGNPDFRHVCVLAGMDPDAVWSRYERALEAAA